jgi:hypothetical protein
MTQALATAKKPESRRLATTIITPSSSVMVSIRGHYWGRRHRHDQRSIPPLAPPAEGAPPPRDTLRQPTRLGRFEMPVM